MLGWTRKDSWECCSVFRIWLVQAFSSNFKGDKAQGKWIFRQVTFFSQRFLKSRKDSGTLFARRETSQKDLWSTFLVREIMVSLLFPVRPDGALFWKSFSREEEWYMWGRVKVIMNEIPFMVIHKPAHFNDIHRFDRASQNCSTSHKTLVL